VHRYSYVNVRAAAMGDDGREPYDDLVAAGLGEL
jgi:hypothetical protein